MIFRNVNRRSPLACVGLSVLAFTLGANTLFAQEKQEKYKFSGDEGKIAKKVQDGKIFESKMTAAADFVKKFPNSAGRRQIALYMANEVRKSDDASRLANAKAFSAVFNTPEEQDLMGATLVDLYLKQKDYENAFKVGESLLKRQPLEATARLQLATEGANLARTGDGAYIEPSIQCATEFITLVESDKRQPDLSDEKWKEYKTLWLPNTYESRGVLYQQTGRNDEARKDFEKALALNPAQINSAVLMAIMSDDEYQVLARKYQSSSGTEQDAALKTANTKLDETIELMARAVAVTDGNSAAGQINSQLRDGLTTYFKYRHKTTDGLQTLIDKYKKK